MFWNNVQDREGDDIDVTRLIKRAKFDIFLSGITLNYVIESQAELIRTAIKERGVRVLMVIASDSKNSGRTYKRYTRNIDERLPQSHRNYCDFVSTLTPEEAGRIDIRETALLITHSIGMYDKEIYISEFCLDVDSRLVPSYCLTESDSAYRIFVQEIGILTDESRSIVKNPR